MSADDITTFRVLKKRKKEETPPKESQWFLTVNSNRTFEELGEEGRRDFEEKMKKLWSKPFALLKVPPNSSEGVGPFHQPPREKIVSVDCEIAFEVGEKHSRVHMHGRLTVIHRTRVQLNLALIHSILAEMMGVDSSGNPGIFFKARWVQSAETQRIENYLTKPNPEKFSFHE